MPRILTQSFSKIECTYNVFFIHNASQSHNMNCAIWLITSTFALIHSISPSTSTLAGGPSDTQVLRGESGCACACACTGTARGLVHTYTRLRASTRLSAWVRGLRWTHESRRAARRSPTRRGPCTAQAGTLETRAFAHFFFFLMYHNEQETYVMKYFQRSIFNYHLQSTQL